MAALDYLRNHGLHPESGGRVMGRWLEKIQNGGGDTPRKPPESPLRGLGGVVDGAYSENKPDVQPVTTTDWLEWIAERCPLVPEDYRHVATGLLRLHPRMQQRLAERYVETWQTAADVETVLHKRDNVGRRAANLVITRLRRENEYDWQPSNERSQPPHMAAFCCPKTTKYAIKCYYTVNINSIE